MSEFFLSILKPVTETLVNRLMLTFSLLINSRGFFNTVTHIPFSCPSLSIFSAGKTDSGSGGAY